jgi:hypothetical protein
MNPPLVPLTASHGAGSFAKNIAAPPRNGSIFEKNPLFCGFFSPN